MKHIFMHFVVIHVLDSCSVTHYCGMYYTQDQVLEIDFIIMIHLGTGTLNCFASVMQYWLQTYGNIYFIYNALISGFLIICIFCFRKVTLSILGLDNAGKTVTAKSLQKGKLFSYDLFCCTLPIKKKSEFCVLATELMMHILKI